MAAIRDYDPRDEDAARRLLLPLDAESRTMLDELVTHFYPEHNGLQHNRHRGLVVEMALRAFYRQVAPKRQERQLG